MKVTEISKVDGEQCANLINLLKAGRWDLSGKDVVAYTNVLKWVQSFAYEIASHLKATTPPTPATDAKPSEGVPETGFSIKSRGTLPTAKPKKSNKKK